MVECRIIYTLIKMEARLETEIILQIATGGLETVKALAHLNPSLLAKNNDACIEAVMRNQQPHNAEILLYLLQHDVKPKAEAMPTCFDTFCHHKTLGKSGYEALLGPHPKSITITNAVVTTYQVNNFELLSWLVEKYNSFIFPKTACASACDQDVDRCLINYALSFGRQDDSVAKLIDVIFWYAKKPSLKYMLNNLSYLRDIRLFADQGVCQRIMECGVLDKLDYLEALKLAVKNNNVKMVHILARYLHDATIPDDISSQAIQRGYGAIINILNMIQPMAQHQSNALGLIARGELDMLKTAVKNGLDVLSLIADRDPIELVSADKAGLQMLTYLKDLEREAAEAKIMMTIRDIRDKLSLILGKTAQ